VGVGAKSGLRSRLDDWFPTLARYLGVGILVYETAFDNLEKPSLIVAASGLIFFKNILRAGNGEEAK